MTAPKKLPGLYSKGAKRLPPYGKQFNDARKNGQIPRRLGLGHLVCKMDWNEPSAANPCIVIPPEVDYLACDLSFVAGLHVTVLTGLAHRNRIMAVVNALLDSGAAMVDVIDRDALMDGKGLDYAWHRFDGGLRHAA